MKRFLKLLSEICLSAKILFEELKPNIDTLVQT